METFKYSDVIGQMVERMTVEGNEGSDEDKRLKQIYYNWKACWWDDKKP